MKYAEILGQYRHYKPYQRVFVGFYTTLISPFVTKLCLKLKLIPNVITLCMIGSGVLGAGFFSLPFLWAKIVGTVLIHLWFVFDCSDGEVARITKHFSKFGKEIDYTAHIINHPLFLFSFLLTILQADTGWNPIVLCLVLFGLAVFDSMLRGYVCFDYIYNLKSEKEDTGSIQELSQLKKILIFTSNIFIQLPNFCLIFPIVYFINAQAAGWYAIVVLAVNILFIPRLMYKWLAKILNQ